MGTNQLPAIAFIILGTEKETVTSQKKSILGNYEVRQFVPLYSSSGVKIYNLHIASKTERRSCFSATIVMKKLK